MKKTELANCPQWLLDADTENEDVDFDMYGILVWSSGNFLGGHFWGDKITRKPISIYGLEWPIIITEIKMQIGCQVHANDAWANFTDKEISRMHAKAADFWNTNKTFLLAICKNEMDAAALTKSKGE